MSNQRYIYWHPGEEKPTRAPSECEALDMYNKQWQLSLTNPKDWGPWPRRWPVTEAEYRTHCYCQAYGIITIPEGWRVVDFRLPNFGESWMTFSGNVDDECNYSPRPILERIEEWIVPTDEDAQRRPIVQVWDFSPNAYANLILVGVTTAGRFLTFTADKSSYASWNFCRMKKETKPCLSQSPTSPPPSTPKGGRWK